MLTLAFDKSGWEDFQYWVQNDLATSKRIIKLIDAILREPRSGIGKPEPLIGFQLEVWSRRITLEHRIVYTIQGDVIVIQSCRYHY